MKRYIACILSCFLFLLSARVALADADTLVAGDSWPTAPGAGDTVFLSDANGNFTSGYTYTGNGTRGSEVLVRNLPGETPLFVTGLAGDAAFTLDGDDHVKFVGINTSGTWRAFDMTTSSVDNITIDSCDLYNGGNSPLISYGAGGSLLKVRWTTFDHADTLNGKTGIEAGNGDGVTGWNNVDSVLIEGCTFIRCSHQSLNFFTNCNVLIFKDNSATRNHSGFGGNSMSAQVLFEGNFMSHPGGSQADSGDGILFQWIDYDTASTAPMIWRFNRAVDETVNTNNTQRGLFGMFAEDENSIGGAVRNLRMYYNTVDGANDASYMNKALLAMITQDYADVGTAGSGVDNAIVNNILCNPSEDGWAIEFQNNLETDNNWWADDIRNNLFSKDTGSTFIEVDNASTTDYYTVAALNALGHASGNKDTAESFVDRANYDFTPTEGTWARGNATYLTLASGSGSSSTSLTVDDALWFCDGWGLIDADSIDIAGTIREIDAVNYSTNVITLTVAATWDDNAEVSLVKNGEIADDVGAVQLANAAAARRFMPMRRD